MTPGGLFVLLRADCDCDVCGVMVMVALMICFGVLLVLLVCFTVCFVCRWGGCVVLAVVVSCV